MRYFLKMIVVGWVFLSSASLFAEKIIQADFYLAPNGNDAWSGKLSEPNSAGTDGPFLSVGRARDAVREVLRKMNESKKDDPQVADSPTADPLTTKDLENNFPAKRILVLLRGGTYRLQEPVVFTSEDSGTKDRPVIYAAYPGEKAIFSGGTPITGWRKETENLWTTTVPGVKEGKWYFHSLWVNGNRCPRARTPNDDWYFAAGPVAEIDRRDPQFNNQDMAVKKGFKFKADDIRPWSNLEDATVVVYHAWTASLHFIESIDEANHIVRFSNPSQWPMGWWGNELRYYVENIREALDAPGEWYLDRKTGVLTYYPRPGEEMTQAEVIAPRLQTLVKLEGDAASHKTVDSLWFANLSFQHTGWKMGRNEVADGQSASFLQDATIFLRAARHCLFQGCEIAHTGGYGLWCERGAQKNQLDRCHLHDLGAGGVRLGENGLPENQEEQAESNTVKNCFIHDGGKVYQEGVGVLIGQSSYNQVVHNEICDFLYSGVSVGWSWGYAPSSAHDNKIEYNHIHHLGYGKLSDMGGIYTLGDSRGTTLRNNLIHDVLSFSYGGWGLYTDEGSTGILLENNVVYRVKDGCFHQHYGKNNIVRNNILAYSFTNGQIQRSRDEEHQSFMLERNIIYFDRANLVAGSWNKGTFPFDYNDYWDASGRPLQFPGGLTFGDWQAQGQDRHSMVADPLFVDPKNGDFTLKPDSPAFKLGFKPIDIREIGLQGDIDKEWPNRPKKIKRPAMKFPGE